ncbi:DUF1987 domain-containing protein [Parvicella tangerina]|uniref:DUF1987 domain-containing protein n=1 Tax=Parvicella tangerina TaxID=2829795 RepID=UPI00215BBCDC|nr:DUF1987 domain-containing protein [Parvicella tangerina]
MERNKTKNTPEIKASLTGNKGVIEIVGNSFPENAKSFYADLVDWLKSNEETLKEVEFNSDFHYMASSSLICFLDVLRTAIQIAGDENCTLNWKYEEDDDDILKVGQNFSKILSLKINLIPY